jgi:hypothetical protein
MFKGYKITDLTRPIELSTTMNKVATRNPMEYGSENDYVLLVAIGRTRSTRLYCFLQRKSVVHPRLVSVPQWDNMGQVRLTGICLPKPDVMLD